jgi:hypothetical protein
MTDKQTEIDQYEHDDLKYSPLSKEYWKSLRFTRYWHAEVIVAIPILAFAFWWAMKVLSLLEQIANKL